ncbi:MAG: type secretion system protein [Acidimicrobiales bacterium]|nr:type secretion system protein [Acidimicrobiales bacterium]
MHDFGLLLFVAAAFGGAGLALAGYVNARRPATDAMEYLGSLDGADELADEFQQHLALPFISRVIRPLSGRALQGVGRFTPANHLDGIHRQLLLAGLSASLRAEEFLTIQAVLTGLSTVGAIAWVVFSQPSARMGLLALIFAPVVSFLIPQAWLSRKVQDRQAAILKDLPDTLDLLAISVEAGMGFEGAIEIVCRHFQSPLADEFSRTLKEMELGLPRRDAFQNLKRRTEVPELSNFVLAITQADALGIPIGRVLKTQASEMRSKRRQWARERAGKLPVKILFPLIAFIFPAILVILLGPAGSSIKKAFSS